MDLFDEIAKAKQDFPKVKNIQKEVKGYSINFYQGFAIALFILILCLGVILGNIFATCEASSYFYSDACIVKEFNVSLMIFIWFIGMLISLFIFSIGHIITLLQQINEKLSKFKL